MSVAITRPYRGVSATERTRLRRESLIEGLLDVVLADGTLGVSVDKVCARANLTKRYFYESFKDLDALFAAAADAMYDRLLSHMIEADRGSDGNDRLRSLVADVIENLAADSRIARLYTESPGHPVLRQRRTAAIQSFAEYLGRISSHSEGAKPLDAARAYLVVAGATDLITGFLDGSIATTKDHVIHATADMAGAISR